MKTLKSSICRIIHDYHEVIETINNLKLLLSSPTVLSCKEWYKNEMMRLLREEEISEEKIPELTAELLNENTTLNEKLQIYEKKKCFCGRAMDTPCKGE